MKDLSLKRVRQILDSVRDTRMLVVGDLMLDQFIWGSVRRISPEAPVPVVEFQRESFMPGGAANVARNLTALGGRAEVFGAVGHDHAANQLKQLLTEQRVDCAGCLTLPRLHTSIKTRVVAHTQQVVRVDRETHEDLDARTTARLLAAITAFRLLAARLKHLG